MEAAIYSAVKRTTKRGKRELEVAGSQLAGKPFMPRQGSTGGYITSGQEVTGARTDNVIFRRPKAKAKAGGR